MRFRRMEWHHSTKIKSKINCIFNGHITVLLLLVNKIHLTLTHPFKSDFAQISSISSFSDISCNDRTFSCCCCNSFSNFKRSAVSASRRSVVIFDVERSSVKSAVISDSWNSDEKTTTGKYNKHLWIFTHHYHIIDRVFSSISKQQEKKLINGKNLAKFRIYYLHFCELRFVQLEPNTEKQFPI